MKLSLAILLFSISGVFSKEVCPLKCPSCTMCSIKKGTCSLPRDFVSCTKAGVAGICYAGTCNTKLSLPGPVTTNKCQTYNCPTSGTCTLITAPDGTNCAPLNVLVAFESVCLKGVCQRILPGVTDLMPFRNIGCTGMPDGTVCDTNNVFTDGETCQNGICMFANGKYYGYL